MQFLQFVPKWDLEFQFDSCNDEGDPFLFDFRMKGEDAEILNGDVPVAKGSFDAETSRIIWDDDSDPPTNCIRDDADDAFAAELFKLRKDRYLRYGEV